MSNSQFSNSAEQLTTENNYNNVKPKKDNRNIIYGLLIAALAGSWGYFFMDNKKNKEKEIVYIDRITKDSLSQASLQMQFDMLTTKADSLTNNTQQLQGNLADKQTEIQKLKNNIAAILSKKNASAAELTEAKKQIVELQSKIDALYAEVEKLKAENTQLTATNDQLNKDKTQLTNEKTELKGDLDKTKEEKARVEDVASTLHASNVNITAINQKGSKEKETSTAKKADFFRVSFDIDENRISASGQKSLYVVVYHPDGSVSTSAGTFKDRDGKEKQYTNKVDVNYEQGKKMPVSFNWQPGNKFETGDYKVEIYNNGYKIGEGVKTMKKSTFLGL